VFYPVLTNCGTQKTEIKFKFKSTEKKFLISSGGHRTLSFELDNADIENNSITFEIFKRDSDNIIINSIVNREDYYVYLGLKSSEYYDEKSKKNEKECQNISSHMPLSFQWFAQWKCNFQCSYCWQETSKDIYRNAELNKIPWQTWVEIFNRYKPNNIYITGGEPTLYKDLPEFINGLDPNISISMTTNAGKSFDLEKWKLFVNPERIWDMFFSLHPTQWRDINDFYKKVDDYVSFYKPGFCGIEMVASPQNLELIDINVLKQWCNSRKINCRIDDYYVPIKYVSPMGNIDLSTKIDLIYTKTEYSGQSPLDGEGWNTTGSQYTPHYCPAGWKKINIDCKGNVFTCMSAIDRSNAFGEHSMPHYNVIGNIFDENFQLRTKPILCWETYRCSQCDSTQVSVAWRRFSEKKDIYLPLVE
jgi:MoaA/NifB/PqqE/SkfB family radical SAM enzyme